ncbi:cation-translocating P-type ATPase [Acidovorax sp. JG5]|uniref:cation-translocating P-type ATPase n=1 Tax=Acidovorax sp. JG5 TaxID=2822718 RepID=UPI001B3291CD|nr:cation-translocating P-type ATPase [Acidovorax sp. JG5]MBP3981596.1 cation-translocating P-type ATPase [Acidovorax sp. JG5]
MPTDPISPASATASDAHLRSAQELTAAYRVNPSTGLHDDEATQRALQHGANELQDHARRGPLALLADQFKDFMVLVLLGAAVISGVIGDLTDTLVILVIVVLNAIIGFVQAWRADQAMAALRQLSAAHATVLRSGEVQVVPASVLVPGDIVLLEAGNQIPADLRLIEIAQLQVDESALTGESVTVAKQTDTLAAQDTSALGDRINMAFKGTTATHGRARGLVVATGMHTELGKVARLLGGEDRSTPLQLRLAAFGKRLALGVIAICIVIFAVGVLRGESPLLMALTAISLAVAAIPEALPAVVTVLLALGARRMVAIKALVRRLPSVETLGSVTTICSDKTGTLTQNHMHAELLLAQGQRWAPGDLLPGPVHAEALRAAALCNDAARHARTDDDGTPISPSPPATPTKWQGDPTETALVLAAHAGGLDKAQLDAATPRVQEQPFDSDRKRMTTFHRGGSGFVAYTKGAPESVLPRCTAQWTPEGGQPLDTAAVLATANQLAAQGLRVLALARRDHARLPDTNALDDVESQLELLGLIALIDPPRPEAQAAVRDCISAGITPVMITGDHPATARAIAHRLGIVAHADATVLTGADLAQLDDAALRARVEQVHVYARVDPAQKIRIVEALQAQGHFVAMTGDGVNDAPALKRADIGVSMGKGGTDVAREASSLVLLDDNFATIVAAVREGRRIYDNIRKFVRYAMTGNSGEIWTIFLAPLLLLPIPLLPIHILWVNLVTDGLPGLALAAEPAERGIMQRPPRPPNESLFAQGMWQHILGMGLLIAGLCLAVQAWALHTGHAHWQTMVFTVLTLAQMAHVMAIRSESEPLWRLGLASNRPLLGAVLLTFALQMATIYVPFLNPIFRTEPLNLGELGICVAAALVVYAVVELEKAWRRKRRASGSAIDDPAA